MARPVGRTVIGTNEILRFLVLLLAGMVVLQLYIAVVEDNRITLGAYLIEAAIALGYFGYRHVRRDALRMRPYGDYLLHVGTYLIVNGSFWIHVGILILFRNWDAIDSSWYGPLFGMSIFWGIGLLVHTFGAVITRGYDDVHI